MFLHTLCTNIARGRGRACAPPPVGQTEETTSWNHCWRHWTLGVLLGRVFGARLPERATRIGSAVLFAVFGPVLIVTNL